MEKLHNQSHQAPEIGEQLKKNKKEFDFQIPIKEVENGFLGDPESTYNDVIEYTEINKTLYPGKFQEGKRESTEDMDEDTCMLITTCYGDDLYSVTVVNNNGRDKDAYPPENHYPDEMYELFHQLQDKWNIKFPLLELYPGQFNTNSIVLNKQQLLEFIDDMKLDVNEFFEEGKIVASEYDQDTYEKTEDGYEIKNILPTQFLATWTFRNEKLPLVEGNNGDIYMTATLQEIWWNNLSVAGLDTLIRGIKLIYMPDNLIKVSLEYKPWMQSIRDIPEIIAGNAEYGKLSKFTEFLKKNLKKQIEISQKWWIHLPLPGMLNLVADTSKDILVEKSKLKELLKDLGIHVPVALPVQTEGDKESAEMVDQHVLDEKKRQENAAEKIKIHEEEMMRQERAADMMKCVLDDEMICDINYVQDQKYIFVRDQYGLKIVSHNMEYHKDIAEYIGAKKNQIHGGWRIAIDETAKTIKLYGESAEFKKVPEEYHEIILRMLKTQYPEYSVQIQ